jgi:Flp pilus assembly pilin Flp
MIALLRAAWQWCNVIRGHRSHGTCPGGLLPRPGFFKYAAMLYLGQRDYSTVLWGNIWGNYTGYRVARFSSRCKKGLGLATARSTRSVEVAMKEMASRLWRGEEGQDIAEYAVMLAVILVIVIGTIRLIGSNANTVFSNVASSIQ